jgi:8-amino-7-oxononanoate synthase
MERVLSPTEAIINGRKTLLVGTNNYFGLTFDPSCMKAAIEAIRAEGTGTTGSRIANGSYSEHVALEKEIAEFYGKKHCMVFTTATRPTSVSDFLLGRSGRLLLIDADSHASIMMPASRRRPRWRFLKHNDPSSLEARLRLKDKEGDRPGNRLVVLRASTHALGDSAPLKEFIEVCENTAPTCWQSTRPTHGALGEHGRAASGSDRRAGRLPFHRVGTFSKTWGDRRLLRVGRLSRSCGSPRAYMSRTARFRLRSASVRQALKVVMPARAVKPGTIRHAHE